MRRRTYDIICSECGKTVFKYLKYGDGKIIKCYKNRTMKKNMEKTSPVMKYHIPNVEP